MSLKISRFKPWLAILFCGLVFAVSSAWAQTVAELTAAAEQGDVNAQFNLGLMYDNGLGVLEDNATSIMWFTKAAEKGYAGAQRSLGIMYDIGEGVPEDNATAVMWYTKAAEQDDGAAQYSLGLMYATGDGVPEDYAIAYMWSNLAAAQGHELSKVLKEIVTKKMTREDISKAQALSRECLAQDYKNCGY
jgi:TPR repeat protein